MSYTAINPTYYQMLQPDGPWHPGAEGWSVAPYPGWGENPALVGPPRLAVGADAPPACDCTSDRQTGFLAGAGLTLLGFGALMVVVNVGK